MVVQKTRFFVFKLSHYFDKMSDSLIEESAEAA